MLSTSYALVSIRSAYASSCSDVANYNIFLLEIIFLFMRCLLFGVSYAC